MNEKLSKATWTAFAIQSLHIQVALTIRGLGIRSFDYSRTQKPQITRENCQFEAKLAYFRPKLLVLVFEVLNLSGT